MADATFSPQFPNGFFFIRCKSAEMALDVYEGGMLNDFHLIIWPQKMVDAINQLWMHEDGFLINRKSGLVLDIRGGDIKKDKAVIQYSRKPGLAHNQRWQYKDGYISPIAAPQLVLDIRGGEYKDAAAVFLNAKTASSPTQQWLIQPFEDAKSKQDLALLRPPPLQKHLTDFPPPEELCLFHNLVYKEDKTDVSAKEVAGAAAFEAMRIYVHDQAQKHEPITGPHARQIIQSLVAQEMGRLRPKLHKQDDYAAIVRVAEQAASGYFAREYEGQQ